MESVKAQWVKHGVWNTLEHGVSRSADAIASILLLWVLTPEVFAELALAQAWVAPLLILFLSPEISLYREFAAWKLEGRFAFTSRMTALRRFGWAKIVVAFILSFAISPLSKVSAEALLWAFSLTLAPQIAGADREFLRLELQLKQLNFATLYQKITLLAGTAVMALAFPGSIRVLAVMTFFSTATSALLARFFAVRALRNLPVGENKSIDYWTTLKTSIKDFAIWHHFNGVLTAWILTMDLWVLGVLSTGERVLGLYAVALKIANFAIAIPLAASNVFLLWVSRRERSRDATLAESSRLRTVGWTVAGVSFVQFLVLMGIGKWILAILSRGRWTEAEQAQVYHWMLWILGSGVILGGSLPLNQWITMRMPIRGVLFKVGIPLTVMALVVYFVAASLHGPDGTARANVLVAFLTFLMSFLYVRKNHV